MKVYRSGYRNHWLSPYTVLEKIVFWREIDYDEPAIEWWSNALSPISVAIRATLDFIHPQVSYVKIDKYDTWNMDDTLSTIILPMLIQLKATKHGSPFVDDEDVPTTLRSTTKAAIKSKKNDWDTDCNIHRRWNWVMDELIWTFEQLQPNNDWEAQYYSGTIDFTSIPIDADGKEVPKKDAILFRMDKGPKDTHKFNGVGYKKHQARITNGTRLFGKYFQGLWD